MSVVSLACQAFLTTLQSLLSSYPIYDRVLYDPDLTYDKTLRRYIVSEDIDFKDTQVNKNWVGVLWNREMVTPSEAGRRHVIRGEQVAGQSVKYAGKFAKLKMEFLFISSDMDTLEQIEEFLFVKAFPDETNMTLFSVSFKVGIQSFELSGFQSLDIEQYGSLSALSGSAGLHFPVVLQEVEASAIILYPLLTIYPQMIHDNYETDCYS